MVKKVFALAGITALTGLVSAAAAVGCSSSTTTDAPAADAGKDSKAGEGGTPVDPDAGATPEEKTVGKLCKTNADCEVAGTVGDNQCSIGSYKIGDLFGDGVCIQAQCNIGTGGTFDDIVCDGDQGFKDSPGVCVGPTGATTGTCLPACEFSPAKITADCAGGHNKCAPAFFGTGTDSSGVKSVFSLGECLPACTKDADCTGSAGQKCQVEDGICVLAANLVTYPKAPGSACDGSKSGAAAECNCAAHSSGPNKDKGYCTLICFTGDATQGDAYCNAKMAGTKCSAGLPTEFSDKSPAFTTQPDGVFGTCSFPCTVDGDCAAFGTLTGGTAKCEPSAGGGVCTLPLT